jgi:hypothetical protein
MEPGAQTQRTYSGGCQCGAVRYEAAGDPQKIHYCHCRMCQKAVGNLFATLVPFRRADVSFSRAAPKSYRSSSVAERGFCGECGTPLSFAYLDSPWLCLTLGSLDQPAAARPEVHYGVESQVPWLRVDDDLPRVRTDEDDGIGRLQGMVIYQHGDAP